MGQKKTSSEKLLKMPIDQFGRYFIISETIKELAKLNDQSVVNILDIGGYNGSFHKFFAGEKAIKFNITILDLYESNAKNYVKGSALDIPFKDNSYDYCVSFEVFEHIARQHRSKYISEATRVAKGPFIMSAPFNGENDEVLKSEVLLNDLWKNIHNKDHEWLKEHIEYKTPKPEEIEKIFKAHNLTFKKIGNNDLTLWNFMQSVAFLTTIYRPDGQNQNVQEFYNKNLDLIEGGDSEFYRHIYIIGDDAKRNLNIYKTKKDENKKKQIVNELINMSFKSIANDLKKLNHQKEHLGELLLRKETENELLAQNLENARAEIQTLKSSASWMVARKISQTSKFIPGKDAIKKRIKNEN